MNRAILIVICDFLVSAMLSMMTGLVPSVNGGIAGNTALDSRTAALIVAELRSQRDSFEDARRKLLEAQQREGFSQAREDQLKALSEQLAETLAKTEILEEKLKLRPDNAAPLSAADLQDRLNAELRKKHLMRLQFDETRAELLRLKEGMKAVSGNLVELNTSYAVSQQQLADTKEMLEQRESKLADTGEELSRTRENLAATKAQLSSTEQQLAGTRRELEGELARMGALRTRTASLEEDLSFTRGRLSAAERELAESRSQIERIRRQASARELESSEAKRQLANVQTALKNAVSELSKTKAELARTRDAASSAGEELIRSQGQAESAAAKLQAAQAQLEAAQEKLRSDVLEKYYAAAVRLDFTLEEARVLINQKGGGVFYLPLVDVGGVTVLPGYYKQMTGDFANPLNFDRVLRLEYRVNPSTAPESAPGVKLAGPLLAVPGEPRVVAIAFTMTGRTPLKALSTEALKQRGLQDLYLFKTGSFGKESAALGARCSIDFSAGDRYLYIRNTRGSGSELRAEPGDFVMTKQGDFVGVVVSLQNVEGRQEARCFVFPESFNWSQSDRIVLDKAPGAAYFDEFASSVKKVREKIDAMERR